jgi:hypothetical protein
MRVALAIEVVRAAKRYPVQAQTESSQTVLK